MIIIMINMISPESEMGLENYMSINQQMTFNDFSKMIKHVLFATQH